MPSDVDLPGLQKYENPTCGIKSPAVKAKVRPRINSFPQFLWKITSGFHGIYMDIYGGYHGIL